MPATTANYNFNQPTVRGDRDQWGGFLNNNWGNIDGLLLGAQTSFYGSVTPPFPTNPDTKKGTFWFNTTNFATTGVVPLTVWDGAIFVTIGELNPTEHTFVIPGASFIIGQITPYAGIDLTTPIPLWQFCNGEAISRTTFAALFGEITQTFTGITDGTTSLISVANTTNLQTGWFVSGTGIPSGATIISIITNTSITISVPTTGAGTNNLVGAPYGVGDGSATFNVPNLNGRLPKGQGNNGTTNYNMGATGGFEDFTLGVGNLPNHTHDPAINSPNSIGAGFVYAKSGVTFPLTTGVASAVPAASVATTSLNTGGVTGFTTTSPIDLRNPYTTVNYIIFAGV
jgi:microcystin-dependent protein